MVLQILLRTVVGFNGNDFLRGSRERHVVRASREIGRRAAAVHGDGVEPLDDARLVTSESLGVSGASTPQG